jgi:hypothetical protein
VFRSYVTSSTAGKFVDMLRPEDRETLREGAMTWPWEVKVSTLFTYGFGGNDESINTFQPMMDAAKLVSGAPQVGLYAHNVSETAARGSVASRTMVPHRRRIRSSSSSSCCCRLVGLWLVGRLVGCRLVGL